MQEYRSAAPPRPTRLAPPTLLCSDGAGAARSPSRTRVFGSHARTSPEARIRIQEATAAGDAATGFDFSDAAHMAAELAPMLGGAPAGQRGR